MKNKVDLFLDSGAFSAWAQGQEIKIEDYIAFIKENESSITTYSNLDVIGDPRGTWQNQKIMEQVGLSPLPVFHYGSDLKWLKKILKKGYKYMALGGMVPISTQALIPWLDDLFSNYLTDEKGMPFIKVHGFGLTSLRLLFRYPWFSVDSTSWVVTGRLGSIFIPVFKNGEWDYLTNPWKVAVSNKSPKNKEKGQHITTLTKTQRKNLELYLKEKGHVLGKSSFEKIPQETELKENQKWAEKKPKSKKELRECETILERGLSNDYKLRDEINIMYFNDLEKHLPKWPYKFELKSQNTLF